MALKLCFLPGKKIKEEHYRVEYDVRTNGL